MYETLVRQHDLAVYQMPSLEDAVDKLKDIESRKKSRRAYQKQKSAEEKIETLKRKAQELESGDTEPSAKKMKKEEGEGEGEASINETAPAEAAKEDVRMESTEELASTTRETSTEPPRNKAVEQTAAKADWKKPSLEEKRYSTTKPAPQGRGHTSYLTFAFLMPQMPTI